MRDQLHRACVKGCWVVRKHVFDLIKLMKNQLQLIGFAGCRYNQVGRRSIWFNNLTTKYFKANVLYEMIIQDSIFAALKEFYLFSYLENIKQVEPFLSNFFKTMFSKCNICVPKFNEFVVSLCRMFLAVTNLEEFWRWGNIAIIVQTFYVPHLSACT